MPLSAVFRCIAGCAGTFPLEQVIYRCPTCGELLEVVHDLEALRATPAAKWQQLNKDASDQVWIIPLLFGLSQHIAGTNVGNLFRWTPYASWPYAQLYAKYS